jgi:hypothetical protein
MLTRPLIGRTLTGERRARDSNSASPLMRLRTCVRNWDEGLGTCVRLTLEAPGATTTFPFGLAGSSAA